MSNSAEKRLENTTMRKAIAERLKEAQNTAMNFTTFDQRDMSALIDLKNA